MAELKLNGYYTLEDGTKSTDPINAKFFTKRGKKKEGEEGDSKEVKSAKTTKMVDEESKLKPAKVIQTVIGPIATMKIASYGG